MNTEPSHPSRSRDNLLAVSLVLIVGGMFLFFLYLITLGVVGNVMAGIGIFVFIIALHYVTWGRSLSQEVAPERDALRRQDEREAQPMKKLPMDAIQDMSRTQGIQKK